MGEILNLRHSGSYVLPQQRVFLCHTMPACWSNTNALYVGGGHIMVISAAREKFNTVNIHLFNNL